MTKIIFLWVILCVFSKQSLKFHLRHSTAVFHLLYDLNLFRKICFISRGADVNVAAGMARRWLHIELKLLLNFVPRPTCAQKHIAFILLSLNCQSLCRLMQSSQMGFCFFGKTVEILLDFFVWIHNKDQTSVSLLDHKEQLIQHWLVLNGLNRVRETAQTGQWHHSLWLIGVNYFSLTLFHLFTFAFKLNLLFSCFFS